MASMTRDVGDSFGGVPFRRATIVFCLLTAMCEGIDLQAAGVAAAGIGAEFELTPDQFGTFFSASTFGLFLGAILGGRLADTIGRKRILVASVGFFAVFSLLTAFAWDVQTLIAARLMTGFGIGGALPMVLALVSEASPDKQQRASVAMVYAATPFGGAVISLISLLGLAAQWRVIFIVGGAAPLLLMPCMAFGLHESAAFEHAHHTAGMPRAGSFRAILADGRAARSALLWISSFLALLLLYLLLNWLPTLLVTDGLSHSQASTAQIGFNLGGSLAAVLMGYTLGGGMRGSAVIFTFVALPLLLTALAKAPANPAMIMILVSCLGCIVIAAQAFLYATAPVIYPTSIRGVGVGLAVAMGRIGSIVGPKLGGYLKSAGHGPSELLMDLIPLVVLGSICALLLAWRSLRD
jgi:AAHS family 3-hydroxyphenylpropionic acid transporter